MKLSPKLWCLFGVHESQIIREGDLSVYGFNDELVRTRRYYDLRCHVCGRLRMKKL